MIILKWKTKKILTVIEKQQLEKKKREKEEKKKKAEQKELPKPPGYFVCLFLSLM